VHRLSQRQRGSVENTVTLTLTATSLDNSSLAFTFAPPGGSFFTSAFPLDKRTRDGYNHY